MSGSGGGIGTLISDNKESSEAGKITPSRKKFETSFDISLFPMLDSGNIDVAADETLPPEKQVSKLKRFLEAVNQLALPEQESVVQDLIFRLVVCIHMKHF